MGIFSKDVPDKSLMYSVFDIKAGIFFPPFPAMNDGVAIRTIAELVNNPQSFLSKHPSDLVLFKVGAWDDSTGVLKNFDNVQLIALSQLVEVKP